MQRRIREADRTFNASPLIRPADVDRSHDDLTKGRVLGYLPVPASDDGTIPEAVVDLTYRVTLDRLDVRKVVSVSEVVRTRLRYALARLDSPQNQTTMVPRELRFPTVER